MNFKAKIRKILSRAHTHTHMFVVVLVEEAFGCTHISRADQLSEI